MTCRELADFLMEYIDGGLSQPTLVDFERHLHACPNCRRYLAAYRTAIALGQRAFDDDDQLATAAGVPEDLVEAILAARLR